MSESKRSLFEYLGVADQERIHTQTLAWIFHPENSPLELDDYIKIYKNFFDIKIDKKADVQSVVTELANIDLIITTKDAVLVLENKFKSKQSIGQLKKYQDYVENETEYKEKEKKYFFLALSGEKSATPNWNDKNYSGEKSATPKWNDKNYSDVLVALSEIKNYPYVTDYISLINNLVKAKKFFIENAGCRKEIFARSGLKNKHRILSDANLNSYPEEIKFICTNKLERLFTEIYYIIIIEKLGQSEGVIDIGESQGKALIQVDFTSLNFTTRVGVLGFKKELLLGVGMQIQGGTIKQNIRVTSLHLDQRHIEYTQSLIQDFPMEFTQFLDSELKKLADLFEDENSLNNRGKANKGKTKFYRSYSKSLESSEFQSKSVEGAADFLKTEIANSLKLWTDVLKKYEQSAEQIF